MTYIIFDKEATSLDTRTARPTEFGAILTDDSLEITDQVEIKARLDKEALIEVGALGVTGGCVKELRSRNTSEYQMILEIHRLLNHNTPATWVAYNLPYDRALMRFSSYRNLLPAYEDQKNGNCGIDALALVRAAAALRSESLKFSTGNSGRQSFKLVDVARENGFVNHRAHAALGDCEATLDVLRKIREGEPKLFRMTRQWSQKKWVADIAMEYEVFFRMPNFGKPKLQAVTAVCANPKNPGELVVVALDPDPTKLLSSSDPIAIKSPVGLMKTNSCPAIFPPDSEIIATAICSHSLSELRARTLR